MSYDIPGFRVDDSPDRPPHRLRVEFDRNAVAVRAALALYDPDRLADFEAEFHVAMAEADDDFDLARVDEVIKKWYPEALLAANPEYASGIERDTELLRAGLLETWRPEPQRGGWVRVPGENDPNQEEAFKPFGEVECQPAVEGTPP